LLRQHTVVESMQGVFLRPATAWPARSDGISGRPPHRRCPFFARPVPNFATSDAASRAARRAPG
jgi:hypothetical protein